MRSLLRPANLFVVVTYLILSAVPFAPLLFGRTVEHPERVLGMEFVAWVAIWGVLKRPARFHWALLPAFLALPIELYLNAYFGQGISPHHLGIIVESSPKEALEFLGGKAWLLAATGLGMLAWWWLVWCAARRTCALDWIDPSRWVMLGLLSCGFGLWLYGYEYGVGPHAVIVSSAADADEDVPEDSPDIVRPPPAAKLPKLPAWAEIPFDVQAFGKTWPFGLAVLVHTSWKERRYLSELARKNLQFKFGTQQSSLPNTPQVVVMVIGESSRYDRWSINGYTRETTPLLEKETNLVSLSNVVTAVSATRLSVPILVSRKPARQSLQAGFAEKSFLSAFREAGFKTWWLSNQMSFGQFDTPVSVFAQEADVTQFLNLGGLSDKSSYDNILLDPLRSAIADPSSKKLIVLHTLGSHWNYSHRHPKDYDKWKPSLFGIDNPAYTDPAIKQQMNNSYDNSILYMDWFLSQVIASLKASGQMTALMYVSDHGQTLYDGTCNLAFHGHNTQYEFHVPALVWYSDLYRAVHPDKVKWLLRHRRVRLATENIFHSLLDMADIRYGSEQLEWSFVNRKFRQHKRYVDSYGWTDYDNATFKGDCREVIDRGTPLPRDN